jgi:hypothetical protein
MPEWTGEAGLLLLWFSVIVSYWSMVHYCRLVYLELQKKGKD